MKKARFQERICVRCGKLFTPSSGTQKYCSTCKKDVTREKSSRFRKMQKERGKQLQCCICGAPFGEMVHGKPYCWKHRARYQKYKSFDLPGRAHPPICSFEIEGETLTITTAKKEKILADAEDFEILKDLSWRLNSNGYAVSGSRGSDVYMHRLVMKERLTEGEEIDHINGDTADNRKKNLRICEHKENLRNLGIQKNNTSGHPGVYLTATGKYRAIITADYKAINLGTFDTFEEAVSVRRDAEDRYHGIFAGHIRREMKKE